MAKRKMEKEQVMNWKPIGDQVLLKVEKTAEKTKSGIILVDRDMAFMLGEVVATGVGLFTQTGDKIPMTVNVGNTVLLHSRLLKGDNEVEVDGEKYILVRESEIAMYHG